MSPARTLLLALACVALILITMTVITARTLSLERTEAESRLVAERERTRLRAQERVESILNEITAREDVRPYFHYLPFYSEDGAYTRLLRPVEKGAVLVPSPLLGAEIPYCLLHFQIAADGTWTSPQSPAGNQLDVAEMWYTTGETAINAKEALEHCAFTVDPTMLSVELEVSENAITQSPMRWTWASEESPLLVLSRAVRVEGQRLTQGVWIDWPVLRAALATEIAPLGEGLAIEASSGPLPVRVSLSGPEPTAALGLTPTRITLGIAWIVVLGAIVAIAIALRSLADLGERRGRFVSAVTHELRTPLTTFRLYSHLLAEGRVPDEQKREEFHKTLRTESDRLERIVENVLCYARLSDVRGQSNVEPIEARDALRRIMPALESRATDSEMTLESETDTLGDATIEVDVQSLERALLNLVDNACKYAGDGGSIRLEGAQNNGFVDITVADHGPGIEPARRKELFRPFARAERSGSGLGLGLALARELARERGGDLDVVDCEGFGAVLRLRLPAL